MQHMWCATAPYLCEGFFESDDHESSRHVCHLFCLRQKVARDTLVKLRELALQRRIMNLLLSEEVDDTQELGEKLGMLNVEQLLSLSIADTYTFRRGHAVDKVTELVTPLEQQGLIVEQSKRRTRTSRNFVSTPGYVHILPDLFDPYQVVGHNVSPTARLS